MIINGIKIEFTPAHAMNYKYIVCRKYEELFFYYGAFNDEIKARNVATEINGYCVYNRQ
jgi:hypothetical protein